MEQLLKIQEISSVGSLGSVLQEENFPFKKINAIFANNRIGKSTFCAILRSLKLNDPEIILGRETLGVNATQFSKVVLKFETQVATFENNVWNLQIPEIEIFDSTFVAENIFSPDAGVDTDHRRNLHGIIIGEEGFNLSKKIEKLRGFQRKKQTKFREIKGKIEKHTGSFTIEQFVDPLPLDNIDETLKEKVSNLEILKKLHTLSGTLKPVALPELPLSINILSKTLPGVEKEAEGRVLSHISKHKSNPEWVEKGLGYITEHQCGFCSQDLEDINLIDDYKKVFSEKFKNLLSDIEKVKMTVEEQINTDRKDTALIALNLNSEISKNWTDIIDFNQLSEEAITKVWDFALELRPRIDKLLLKKKNKILEKIEFDDEEKELLKTFHQLIGEARKYNAKVKILNKQIEIKKEEFKLLNIQELEDEIIKLTTYKKRGEEEVNLLCKKFKKLNKNLQKLQELINTFQAELTGISQGVSARYGDKINNFLNELCPGLRIELASPTNIGGIPNVSFQIQINNTSFAPGNAETPLSEPSLKNTLSISEKNALGFSFFLAKLETDPGLNSKILVFDDPFNSMDRERRSKTANFIREFSENSKQTFVFSHEPYFLKKLWDKIANHQLTGQAIQIIFKKEGNLILVKEDNFKERIKTQYYKDLIKLEKFVSENIGEVSEVEKIIRPILETYLRNQVPYDQNLQSKTLGQMVVYLEEDNSHPLHSQPLLEKLRDLNSEVRQHHHGIQQTQDPTISDENEVRDFARDTLRILTREII